MLHDRESRPPHQGPAQSISTAIKAAACNCTPDHNRVHGATVLLSEKAVTHAHAVLVWTPEDKFTRRLFLSLHAADKAMERAAARGLKSSCVMVELVPVPGVPIVVVGGEDQ
jgi:hypothetical protein